VWRAVKDKGARGQALKDRAAVKVKVKQGTIKQIKFKQRLTCMVFSGFRCLCLAWALILFAQLFWGKGRDGAKGSRGLVDSGLHGMGGKPGRITSAQ
jgi:hypothetical protein